MFLPPFPSQNFTLLDEGMIDFLTAADSSVRTSIPNFRWVWRQGVRSLLCGFGGSAQSSLCTLEEQSTQSTAPSPPSPLFSTPPNWLFNNSDRSYFPDDPLGETFSYESGLALIDPTGTALGDYYGRLLAHYLEPGGFIDEAGNVVPGVVGGPLTFSHWEVLNEVRPSRSSSFRPPTSTPSAPPAPNS